MKVIKIDKNEWEQGLKAAAGPYQLVGPTKKDAFHAFAALGPNDALDLDFQNSRLSPKHAVFPQSEIMFQFSTDESAKDHDILKPVEKTDKPVAVVGIRPCDAYAFLLVKRNFDTPQYKDPFWLDAYEKATYIGLACQTPCATCFCTSAGTGPHDTQGLDVLLADAKEAYFAQILTEKGEAFVQAAGWAMDEAGDDARKAMAELKTEAEGQITARVSTSELKNKETLALYDAPFWEDVAFACINCGTCTYVCPTCWCFDIQDETCGETGVRMRNWDSCMFPLFTLHGTGHNPRGEKVARVRQRFMHKLKYYVDKYDNGIQCVGCGRCIRSCPVNIDIRTVCEKMNAL